MLRLALLTVRGRWPVLLGAFVALAAGVAVTAGAIAAALVVSEATVGKHIRNLFDKLDLAPAAEHHRRVLAVVTYLQAGSYDDD
jgi:DNA-binding NarL/FixJ family response regulator